MKHARPDYDDIQDPSGRIPEDEPVFLLRAQDILAPDLVAAWARQAARSGVSYKMSEMALEQADRMREWRKKKTPDLPEGK
jgi:hypothetical protein